MTVLIRGLKVERYLRSHSIVAENADVMRYTIKGDIDGLRRLFSQRAASVHDSTQDGWSLLHVSSPLPLLLLAAIMTTVVRSLLWSIGDDKVFVAKFR